MKSIKSDVYDKNAVRDIVFLLQENDWIEDKIEELMFLWGICDDNEQKNLLKELINDFFVLDDKKLSSACSSINEQIKLWELPPEKSLIIAVADKGKSDGSFVGLKALENKIKPLEEWIHRYVYDIPSSIEKMSNGDNIILFDDFVGSGDKFEKKYKWLCDLILREPRLNIETISFYFISFSGMEFGLRRLKNNGYNIYVKNILNKGISEKFDHNTSIEKIRIIKKLEEKLSEEYNNMKLNNYSLGYKESESLYLWKNYSCPNNVFPIFWWPKLKSNAEHESLLPRAKK